MMIKNIFYLLNISLLTTQSFAYSLVPSQTQPILAFSIGPAWYESGQTQTIYLQPDYANTYHALQSTQALVNGEFFLGLEQKLQDKGLGQVGIAIAVTNSAQLQGSVWQTGDPQFDNYAYKYRIKHQHLAAKAKWLCSNWTPHFSPYFSASVGVAQNTAYHFEETPLIYEALPVAGFQAQTRTAFTYTLGAGIDKAFGPHWRTGIGYQLNAWGQSQLGRTPSQTTNQGLNLSNLYAQELEFTLSYLL